MVRLLLFVFAPAWLLAQAGSFERLVQEGDRALAEHRYADAEAAFEKLAQSHPGVAEIHAKLGVIFFQQGKFEKAVPELRQALALKPALPNADVLLAMSLSEQGKFPEALPGLEKGFRRSPADPAIKRMSGLQLLRAYTALKRDGDAVQIALDLTRLHPDDPEILYHAGRLFGNFAYLNMEKLTAVAPKSVWRLLAAGEALESQGNFELAAVRYREVIAQAPERPGIHFRLGRALLKQDQAPQAAEEFERELSVDPTNGNAAYELAEIHRKAGPAEKARRYFELALKHDPDFEDALIGLAKVLAAEGRHDAALPHLRKAIALNPANEVSHYQLARAHRALGNAAEERKELAEFQRLRALARVQENLLRGEVTRQQTDDER